MSVSLRLPPNPTERRTRNARGHGQGRTASAMAVADERRFARPLRGATIVPPLPLPRRRPGGTTGQADFMVKRKQLALPSNRGEGTAFGIDVAMPRGEPGPAPRAAAGPA